MFQPETGKFDLELARNKYRSTYLTHLIEMLPGISDYANYLRWKNGDGANMT